MIGGERNSISRRRNEVFAHHLVGYGKCGKCFAESENKREIKGQIRVMLGPIWLVLFTAKKIFRLREGTRESDWYSRPRCGMISYLTSPIPGNLWFFSCD